MVPGLLALVVMMSLVHENTIYRTQRETYEARQILPGYSVRRVPVPSQWAGQTRYEVRFNPSLSKPLESSDILIVLGGDARLDALLASLEQSGRNHHSTTPPRKR